MDSIRVTNSYIGMIDDLPEKQSMRDAIEHLFARKREIRPLFLDPARPMNVLCKKITVSACHNQRFRYVLATYVIDETVFWSIAFRLESSEQCLFSTKNLYCACWVFRQIGEGASVTDETCTDNISDETCQVRGDK